MVIACRRGHPLRGARSLSQLTDARWLAFNPSSSGSWMDRAFATAGLALPQRVTICESFAFAFELMARSDAIMPVPQPVFMGR
jgi:DNA-binding transcriptional LysR family regulator